MIPRFWLVCAAAIALANTGSAEVPEPASSCPSLVQKSRSSQSQSSSQELLREQVASQERRLQATEAELKAANDKLVASDQRLEYLENLVHGLLEKLSGEPILKESHSEQNIFEEKDEDEEVPVEQKLALEQVNDTRSLLSKRGGGVQSSTKCKGICKTVNKILLPTLDKFGKKTLPKLLKPIMNPVNKVINGVKELAKKAAKFFVDIYEKHLKPMIVHIGKCAKEAGNPMNFLSCLAEPAFEVISKLMLPGGDVAKMVPFMDDVKDKYYDFNSGKYTELVECVDCLPDDPRDHSKAKCVDKEKDLGMGTFKFKVCDAPFGMDPNKDIKEEIKDALVTCAKSAAVFAENSPFAQIPEAIKTAKSGLLEARDVAASLLQDFLKLKEELQTELQSALDQHQNDVKDMAEDAKRLVESLLESIPAAVENCKNAQSQGMELQSLMSSVTDNYAEIPGALSAFSTSAFACKENLNQTYLVVKEAESTNLPVLKKIATDLKSRLTGVKAKVEDAVDKGLNTILSVTSKLGNLKDSMVTMFNSVKTSDFDWKQIAKIPQECAKGKGPYMKLQLTFVGNTPVTGSGELFRMSLHQRSGFKFAWRHFTNLSTGFIVKDVNYTWEHLRALTEDADEKGKSVEFCYILYCVKLKFKLTPTLGNIMGIPLPNEWQEHLSINDHTYFFSFQLEVFELGLKKIGIPISVSIPVGKVFPWMTVPFLVNVPTKANLEDVPAEHEETEPISQGLQEQLNGMQEQENIAGQQAAGTLKMKSDEADTEDADLKDLKDADSACPKENLDED